HAVLLIGELILAQLADALVRRFRDIAGAWLQITAENFHEGRLAGAIGTDQAVAVAVTELDGHIFEQRLGAELHGDVGGGQQCLLPDQQGGRGSGSMKTGVPRWGAHYATGPGGRTNPAPARVLRPALCAGNAARWRAAPVR